MHEQNKKGECKARCEHRFLVTRVKCQLVRNTVVNDLVGVGIKVNQIDTAKLRTESRRLVSRVLDIL